MSDAAAARPSSGLWSVSVLAVLGCASVVALSQGAPSAPGSARLVAPEILLAVFDTVWLLALALPRSATWPAALTKLAVGAPFHAVMAAAFGSSSGFHA